MDPYPLVQEVTILAITMTYSLATRWLKNWKVVWLKPNLLWFLDQEDTIQPTNSIHKVNMMAILNLAQALEKEFMMKKEQNLYQVRSRINKMHEQYSLLQLISRLAHKSKDHKHQKQV